jgi:hypothetical protein
VLSTTDSVFKILNRKLLDIAVDRKTENKTVARVSFMIDAEE